MTARQTRYHLTEAAPQIRAAADLPPGIAGRVSGVALTYETVDTYQTMFARNSAKRSIAGKVAARRVPLLMDHERTSKAHVGVVTEMQDVGNALVMTADIFDTADGRAALEYVKAVLASGASTGFSIGFVPRASEQVSVDGQAVERFTEIELREVSITPMPAVPGAEVAAARAEDVVSEDVAVRTDDDLLLVAARVTLDSLSADARAALLAPYLAALTRTETSATTTLCSHQASAVPTSSATSDASYVPLDARARAVRATFTF